MTVQRRHVFFLSGFDPKGASYYHGLYVEQAKLQGAVTGTEYVVGSRTRRANGNSLWEVQSGATDTCFEYVRWDDIVRAHWPRTAWQVLVGSLHGYAAALASPAALRKVKAASPRTLVALAFPAAFWLAALLVALIVGTLLAQLPLPGRWPTVIGVAAGAGILWATLQWERTLNTSWLLRIYQFAADWRRGRTPQLQARLDTAADDILRALRDPAIDEVLVIGFSVGSLLAASIAARVQRRAAAEGRALDKLALLTLGHCIPLLGLMAGADAYRAELEALGRAPHVRWADYSSPTDWGSFALVDPLAISLGPAGAQRPFAPHMASPRFHTMFPPEVYATLVRDKRRIHLQYLMAGQRPSLYDYFAITAGPQRLQDRLQPLAS